jgi:cardiolipin synthase
VTPRGRRIGLVILTALFTGLLVLLALNLSVGDSPVDRQVESLYGTDSPQFLRPMGVLLGPPLVGGNSAQALLNGDEIFPAMLEAIRGAQRTIDFETYVYWEGTVGKEFADALSERARAGVKVNLLLDWVGSQRMDEDALSEMEAAGVDIRRYHPLHWYTLDRLNNRTHRKILVVDGRIGFTGGVGIADSWGGHAQDPDHWRDTHFRFEGPVVAQMQSAFLDNWIEITGTVLHGEEYFPPIMEAGDYRAQVFTSSPGGGAETAEMMYLLSIAAARKSIDLSMAYFIPDELSLRAFLAARKRGVRIRIITPGPHIDSNIVRRASRASWGPLLEAGVEMHEYQPTLYHCKVMIVDDLWTSVGSTNFDSRSFSVNDEANLNVYDSDFGLAQRRVFEADLEKSRRITLGAWERRPLRERVVERLSVLLNSQL